MTKHRIFTPILACIFACTLVACALMPESDPVQTAEAAPTAAGDADATGSEELPQPAYIRVPNVTADTVQEAVAALEDKGFSVVTVIDWSECYTNGHVAAQSPSGYAPEGACITLTVSRGADPYAIDNGPQTRDIPNVRGYPVSEALEDLEEHGFVVTGVDGPEDGIVTCYEVTGSAPLSAILHTCPASGGAYDASIPSSMRGTKLDG